MTACLKLTLQDIFNFKNPNQKCNKYGKLFKGINDATYIRNYNPAKKVHIN